MEKKRVNSNDENSGLAQAKLEEKKSETNYLKMIKPHLTSQHKHTKNCCQKRN